jgi:hypothetical protein
MIPTLVPQWPRSVLLETDDFIPDSFIRVKKQNMRQSFPRQLPLAIVSRSPRDYSTLRQTRTRRLAESNDRCKSVWRRSYTVLWSFQKTVETKIINRRINQIAFGFRLLSPTTVSNGRRIRPTVTSELFIDSVNHDQYWTKTSATPTKYVSNRETANRSWSLVPLLISTQRANTSHFDRISAVRRISLAFSVVNINFACVAFFTRSLRVWPFLSTWSSRSSIRSDGDQHGA